MYFPYRLLYLTSRVPTITVHSAVAASSPFQYERSTRIAPFGSACLDQPSRTRKPGADMYSATTSPIGETDLLPSTVSTASRTNPTARSKSEVEGSADPVRGGATHSKEAWKRFSDSENSGCRGSANRPTSFSPSRPTISITASGCCQGPLKCVKARTVYHSGSLLPQETHRERSFCIVPTLSCFRNPVVQQKASCRLGDWSPRLRLSHR